MTNLCVFKNIISFLVFFLCKNIHQEAYIYVLTTDSPLPMKAATVEPH